MNKISEATMREILVKLAEETLYVDDYEVEYVIKYLKDFVKLAQVERIIDRIEAKLDKIEERHGNYSRDSSTSNEEAENNL